MSCVDAVCIHMLSLQHLWSCSMECPPTVWIFYCVSIENFRNTVLCIYFADVGLKCGGLFRLSAGNPKLAERLRASFDRTGDADLEGAGDVATVASLLKLWLRELPEPVIASHVATELLDIHESKFLTGSNMHTVACRTIRYSYLVNVKLKWPESGWLPSHTSAAV
jgi:hypothetical protein